MNLYLVRAAAYITSLEEERAAIEQALDKAGISVDVEYDDGKGKSLTLPERVQHALDRMAPLEGPAYNDLCKDSNDLQRLMNAMSGTWDWPKPGVEGALEVIQALRDCPPEPADLRGKLARALNCHSAENASGTPDFILADFLLGCLAAWDAGAKAREAWASPAQGCPKCCATEVDAPSTPRTIYACGSSDYDQRPGTLLQSTICADRATFQESTGMSPEKYLAEWKAGRVPDDLDGNLWMQRAMTLTEKP